MISSPVVMDMSNVLVSSVFTHSLLSSLTKPHLSGEYLLSLLVINNLDILFRNIANPFFLSKYLKMNLTRGNYCNITYIKIIYLSI